MDKRISYLDASKAIAIVMMIFGHCYWKESIPYLNKAIYTFHMPLFFIISGFFVKPLRGETAVKKYARAYLKPYVITCLAILLTILTVDFFIDNDIFDDLKDWALRSFFASGSNRGTEKFSDMPIIGPLWFLFALFWATTIYSVIKNQFEGFDLMIIVLFLFVVSLMSIRIVRLPFSLQAGLCSVTFLWAGDMIRRYSIVERAFQNRAIILCMVGVWLVCILRGNVSVSRCFFELGYIGVIGAVIASVLFMGGVQHLRVGGKIGKITLYILCSHQFVQYLQYIYGNPLQKLTYNPVICLVGEFTFQLCTAVLLSFLIIEFNHRWKKLVL